MREFQTQLDHAVAMKFAQRTATANGEILDLKDVGAVDIVVFTGVVTTADASNRFNFKLQEGNDSGLSDAADVAAADTVVDGTIGGTPAALNNTNLLDKILTRISYRGYKRYIRLVATETGTADASFGAVAVKAHTPKQP